jgi:hypothetical protein
VIYLGEDMGDFPICQIENSTELHTLTAEITGYFFEMEKNLSAIIPFSAR